MTTKATSTSESVAGYGELKQLAEDFWTWRANNQPVSSDDIPRIERPRDWVPDWSRQAIARRRQELADLTRRWQGPDPKSWPIVQQVDYRLIGSALARVHFELDVIRIHERNPGFYVDQTLGLLFLALLKPPPFDETRSRLIINALRSFRQTVADGQENLAGKAIKPFALAAIEKLVNVRTRLKKVADELGPLLTAVSLSDLHDATDDAIAALETFHDWINSQLAGMSEETAVGREAYVYFLKQVALMPYTPEQLLSMGAYEWERSVAFETFEQTRNHGLPELGLFPDQKAQMEREVIEEERARKFLEEKNILTVPGWMKHYRNLPLPPYLEPLSLMGVTDDLTSANRLDEDGISYIKRPHPDLDYFSLSIAKDPRPLIVHEGVPGHYFQMTLSWAHENPMRRQYYDSGANEGIGFYAEELMLQFGFFDDSPRLREIMYNFMRLRALRVEVDVKLALGLFTIDQAADYLEKIVPVDRGTARQEAVFFASSPGQAITYQIGKLQIIKFLADARLNQRDKFNLRSFHDYLWKNGNAPIALLRWEYLGLSDEIEVLDLRHLA
jgi:DTW domain-containing protein YfiP